MPEVVSKLQKDILHTSFLVKLPSTKCEVNLKLPYGIVEPLKFNSWCTKVTALNDGQPEELAMYDDFVQHFNYDDRTINIAITLTDVYQYFNIEIDTVLGVAKVMPSDLDMAQMPSQYTFCFVLTCKNALDIKKTIEL